MEYPKEFDDIRPFFDSEVHDKMKDLIKEPGFEHAVRYVLRDINYEQLCQELLTIDKKKDFQLFIMKDFLEGLTKKTTKGVTGENFGVLDASIFSISAVLNPALREHSVDSDGFYVPRFFP